VRAIRGHLEDRGFTEVEGPVLQSIQGGASARPFVTHHNALDIDLYLRIALELHLKRLIVGGMERVFEIGRVFRNEGIDTRHNPEFTMLEAYQAFADYHDMMDLVEGMVLAAARAALGSADTELVVHYGGHAIDLAATPWPRRRFADMIAETTGETMHPGMPVDEARAVLDRLGLAWETGWGSGRLMKEVYDEKVQHSVVGPVFCIDYPREVSPLARVHRDDPDYVERFELIVAGFELCNAYSEQNDPVAQLAAFEAEARAKAGGDPEAGDVDLDYVRALEQGMPCTGGLGIGIDRLVMLLASVDSIREVILFPTLRPEFAPPPGRGPQGAPRPLVALTPLAAAGVAGPAPVADGGASVVALPDMAPSAHAVPPPPRRRDRHPRAVRTIAALTAAAGVLQLLTLIPVLNTRMAGDPLGFAPVSGDRPVEDVGRAGEDEDASGGQPRTGHDQHARDDVQREGKQGQLPRADTSPDEEREDPSVRPGEDALHRPTGRALVLPRCGQVAHARRFPDRLPAISPVDRHGRLSRRSARTRQPGSGRFLPEPRRRPRLLRTRP